MMTWQLVVLLSLAAYALAVVLIKFIGSKIPKAQAIFFLSICCFLFAVGYRVLSGQPIFGGFDYLAVLLVGFVQAFGVYCQWKAYGLSLSKTSMFDFLSGYIAILLAIIFLSEWATYNLLLIVGLALSIVCAYLIMSGKKLKEEKRETTKWVLYTLGMVVIFGTTTFLMKVFSFRLENTGFLTFWYLGLFLGTIPLLAIKKQNPFVYPGKVIFLLPLLALGIIGSLGLEYWAFQLTEVSRALPFKSAIGRGIPLLVGLLVFQEKKNLSRREKVAYLVGVTAALLIALS